MKREMRNLAPGLVRQRVIIEMEVRALVLEPEIKAYLLELAEVTKMQILSGPHAYSAHELGYAGFVHWRTSGANVYTYPRTLKHPPFVTVDCYTCKPFDVGAAVEFTRRFFEAVDLDYMEPTH